MSARLYVSLTVIIFVLGIASTYWLAKSEDHRMRSDLMVQAKMIGAGMDLERLKDLKGRLSDEGLEGYRALKDQLIAFRTANPLCRFIYIVGVKDDGRVFFFVDSEPLDSKDYSPPGQVYDEASDNFTNVLLTREPYVEGPIPDRWGNWVSALIPMIDPGSKKVLGVLGMDVDARDWTRKILSRGAPAVLTGVFLLVLLNFLFVVLRRKEKIRRRIADSEVRLAESERAYRSIVTNMIDVFFRVNTNNEFVLVSPSAAGLFGYETSDELIGKKADSMWAYPESRSGLLERLRMSGSVRDHEMTARRRDGSEFPLSITVQTIYDDSGNPVGYEGIARDISDRKETEKQIQRAQKMEALAGLAGGVAHDLNNILSGIVSYPDLILMQIPKDSPLRRPIETIRESGMKAAAIVQDLLTLARRGVASHEILNLNTLIIEYLESPEFLKMTSFHATVSVRKELEGDLMNIMGSAVHLSKTIMNLVSNAADAMPDGGVINIRTFNRYVDFTLKGYDHVQEGDYVVLSVCDQGCGISPEDRAHIFEPFFTKKKMGRSGSGLGLAVVWGTVKDHHGYIDVQSTKGRGTTFTLYFPVTRKTDHGQKVKAIAGDAKGNGEKILVVDDVARQREIASAILSQLEYDVSTVGSGEEAVQYLTENRADLVVLDMIMDPGIDGLETYERILAYNPVQKAIITSGYSETDRVKMAQALGATCYLKKPYTLEKLGQAVKEELRKSSRERA